MRFWRRFKRYLYDRTLYMFFGFIDTVRVYDNILRTVLAMMDLPMDLGQGPLFTPRLTVRSRQLFIFQPPRPYLNYEYPRPGVVVIH